MASSEQKPLSLAELVERYRVCWEVWPEYLSVGTERRQVGFQLELCGTHEPEVEHPQPGCPDCQRIFVALGAIADWILPKEKRPSTYRIGPYDQAIRYSPVRRNRPDVTLTIKIIHRLGFEAPVDACEVRCLKEMQERLKELGAQERQWTVRKEHHS